MEPISTTQELASEAPLVRDFMTSPAIVFGRGGSVAQAFELMRQRDIRHLPIVDGSGALVGLLSDRELEVAKRERGISPDDVTVDELMATSPFAVSADTTLVEVSKVLAHRKYGCAVVVDDGQVAGVLTTTDALRALVDILQVG